MSYSHHNDEGRRVFEDAQVLGIEYGFPPRFSLQF